MRREIPAWVAAIVIIVVIAIIGGVFLATQRRQSASPEEIRQKMQIYKSYRMKGITKSPVPNP